MSEKNPTRQLKDLLSINSDMESLLEELNRSGYHRHKMPSESHAFCLMQKKINYKSQDLFFNIYAYQPIDGQTTKFPSFVMEICFECSDEGLWSKTSLYSLRGRDIIDQLGDLESKMKKVFSSLT